MLPKTPVFMRDFVVKLTQRNRGAGRCVNIPGATPKELSSMCPNDTAGESIRIPIQSKKRPNLYALVDPEDSELVSGYRWYASSNPWATYATTSKHGKTIYMHRLIAKAGKGWYVDHINHDGLDNRKANLRVCANHENMRNRSSLQSNNSTGYFGVEPLRSKRFRSCLWIHGKRLIVGIFDTPEEAARARDKAAKIHYGEFVEDLVGFQ